MVVVGFVQPRYKSVWEALALGYHASYLRQAIPNDLQFRFWQGFFDDRSAMVEGASGLDFLAISATSPVYPEACRIAVECKEANPALRTIVGGYHPTSLPQRCLADGVFDYVVMGEGEEALRQIIQGTAPPGVVNGQNVSPLDLIPPPDRKMIRNERTIELTMKNDGERITSMLTQRGCPYDCNFCCDGSGRPQVGPDGVRIGHVMWGNKLRYHGIPRVLDEMQSTIKDWRLDVLKLSDMTTNSDKERLKAICRAIIETGGLGHCQLGSNIHVRNTDAELFQLMAKAGWREVWCGVEAATDRVLAQTGKRITVKMVEDAFQWAHEAGLKTRAYFQIGHWNETKEDIKAIVSLVRRIRPDIFGCTVTCPYPGTETWLRLSPEARERFLEPDFLEQMDEYDNPLWETPAFSNAQLSEIQKWLHSQVPPETVLSWRARGLEGRQKDLAYME